ncbi:MAG: hypothetical protein LUP95_04195 [Euryarchaeota archaeon]|nr:hypothetical protein [Euryarchaeota archaeon]
MLFDEYETGRADEPLTWQEFEEQIRDVLECAGFSTEFRKVFVLDGRRHEIDVVARRFDITLLIDAKRYGKARVRSSSLKAEARKHLIRCEEFDRAFSSTGVPVIVSWLDDALLIDGMCFIVPFDKLEDFIVHVEYYCASTEEIRAGSPTAYEPSDDEELW